MKGFANSRATERVLGASWAQLASCGANRNQLQQYCPNASERKVVGAMASCLALWL